TCRGWRGRGGRPPVRPFRRPPRGRARPPGRPPRGPPTPSRGPRSAGCPGRGSPGRSLPRTAPWAAGRRRLVAAAGRGAGRGRRGATWGTSFGVAAPSRLSGYPARGPSGSANLPSPKRQRRWSAVLRLRFRLVGHPYKPEAQAKDQPLSLTDASGSEGRCPPTLCTEQAATSAQEAAAVDVEEGAVDEAGGVAGQEQDGLGHLVGAAVAAQRRLPAVLVPLVRRAGD